MNYQFRMRRKEANLEHGDEEGGEDGLPLPDPLYHVVKVGHTKEQRAHNYCLETNVAQCLLRFSFEDLTHCKRYKHFTCVCV